MKRKRLPSQSTPVVEPPVPLEIPLSVLPIYESCDTESSRYALGHVQISAVGNQATAVATDGRCMAICRWPTITDTSRESVLISCEAFKTVRMHLKRLKLTRRQKEREYKVTLDVDGTAFRLSLLKEKVVVLIAPGAISEGRFPQWDEYDVPPKKKSMCLDVVLVRQAAELIGPSDSTTTITFDEHDSPVIVRGKDDDGVERKVFFMPMEQTGEE